jgi:hypothetical protein
MGKGLDDVQVSIGFVWLFGYIIALCLPKSPYGDNLRRK